MAYADARLGFHYAQKESTLDGKGPAFLSEDGPAALDPSILEADIMNSPHQVGFRKNSFSNHNGVLSPAESHNWDPPYASNLSVDPASAGGPNTYHEDVNLYPQQGHQQHPPSFPHQQNQNWSFEHGSGHCTPTAGAEFMPPPNHFDGPHYVARRADSVHGSFSQPPPAQHFPPPHPEAGFIPAPQVQTPMSPHTHQDWMGMAQQEMEGRQSQKRMRPVSPNGILTDFRPRDGIRKKNGRIEIPHERNITTIDEMIGNTTDEDLLKELKQQKRLLRNREAALASRQRKKKHTEDLEIKEKSYTSQITTLESRIADLSVECDRREREMHIMAQRLEQFQRHVEVMDNEKREFAAAHNEETSTLRRRIRFLTEQLEAPAMSAAPSSTGFTDFNAEMEALSMDPQDWDSLLFVNDMHHDTPNGFAFDPKQDAAKHSPAMEHKPLNAAAASAPAKRSHDAAVDQPIASGLLFMLLLCGAFVASKPPNAQTADLPKMPADVRAAAPTVLSNLLSESSNLLSQDRTRTPARVAQEPAPSGLPFSSPKASRLDRLHRTITSPSRQQEIDQAFSLTTAQYASLTNTDVPIYHTRPASSQGENPLQPRRNLAQALSSVEEEHARNPNKAEVYTRSLLWDQIPEDVVKQFRQMVQDHNELDARQANHDYDFKIET